MRLRYAQVRCCRNAPYVAPLVGCRENSMQHAQDVIDALWRETASNEGVLEDIDALHRDALDGECAKGRHEIGSENALLARVCRGAVLRSRAFLQPALREDGKGDGFADEGGTVDFLSLEQVVSNHAFVGFGASSCLDR